MWNHKCDRKKLDANLTVDLLLIHGIQCTHLQVEPIAEYSRSPPNDLLTEAKSKTALQCASLGTPKRNSTALLDWHNSIGLLSNEAQPR